MKTQLHFKQLGIVGIFLLLFAGCYTQLKTIHDYDNERDNNREQYRSDDKYEGKTYSERDNDYDNDNWYPRYRVGFSYYYPPYYWPSYAFSVAYYDPWFYDRYWYYDPWWCGTPIIVYPACWYCYPAYYYYPYPYYRYRYWYVDDGIRDYRGGRTFGNTRSVTGRETSSAVRTGDGGMGTADIRDVQLPTGGRIEQSGRTTQQERKGVAPKTQREGNQRVDRSQPTRRPSETDRGERGVRSRDSREQEKQPSTREQGNERSVHEQGSSRPASPSYTPPTVRTPSSQPPANSGRGSPPPNTGNRGGNTRSGRP